MAPRPWNLVAELTYRCPLRCPYCSNPLAHREVRDGLDAAGWGRVFCEAAELGIVHVGLTGGEPAARADLAEIVGHASEAGLYTHLVTSGVPLDARALAELKARGLRSVQLSVQDAEARASDAIAGTSCFEHKRTVARAVRELGLALSVNVVLHRRNIEHLPALIELARAWGADRLELAHTQYHGWALLNRDALLPSHEQLARAARVVGAERERRRDGLELLSVLADYHADRPKPCMGGWGQRILVVAPDARVLPCHAAGELPGLEFWKATDRSLRACWEEAPGMNAFRGEAWMREPCRSCPERGRDFGGCRCQAFALTGDAANTDPACALAPEHARVVEARERAEPRQPAGAGGRAEADPGAVGPSGGDSLVYRGEGVTPPRS